jgi:hypothetical protein
MPEVKKVLRKMKVFCDAVHSGKPEDIAEKN